MDAPTTTPPSWSSTNNTWAKWKAAIEDAGFSVTVPDTTGEEKVWKIKASYSQIQGDFECEFGAWNTDTIRYSKDNGRSWTQTPIALDGRGSSRVTHIQTYNSVRGEWETERNSPQFQGFSGSRAAELNSSHAPWSANNRFIYASADLPRKWRMVGLQEGNTVKVGFQLVVRDSWTGAPVAQGYVEYPEPLIPKVSPHEFNANEIVIPNKTFLLKVDRTGEAELGLISDISQLDDYFGDYHRCLFHFRANPNGKLMKAMGVTGSELRFSNIPNGITDASVLHIHDDARRETVTIQSVNRTVQTATEEEGGYEYYEITVNRGMAAPNSGQSWPVGTLVTADQRGIKHAEVRITAKRNLHAASQFIVYRLLDQ